GIEEKRSLGPATGSSSGSIRPTRRSRARSRSSDDSQEHRRTAGFALKVRIGMHASGATQAGENFSGKGVHEAARIAALADGDQIMSSKATAADGRFPISEPQVVTLRGTSEPVEIVTVDWS